MQLKTILLGAVFLFGMTAMTIANEEVEGEIPCTTIYTLCDFGNPDDFDGFDKCMQRNGCG